MVFAVAAAPPASAVVARSDTEASMQGSSTGFLRGTARLKIPSFSCPPSGSSTVTAVVIWRADNVAAVGFAAKVMCSVGVPSVTAGVEEDDQHGTGRRSFIHASMGDVFDGSFRYDAKSGEIHITFTNVTAGETRSEGAVVQGAV